MKALRILFKTNRFNLSKVGEHFINPCCFGEDLAAWLRIRLFERDVLTREPYQEDCGWELPVTRPGDSYYLCLSGNSDGSSANKDQGEWGIIVEKKRSIGQRLRGLGKIAANDKMVSMIEEILSAEPFIQGVHREGDPAEQGVRILSSGIRLLAVLAGCSSGFAGFLVFGIRFCFIPIFLILGATIQPFAPRLGRWVLAIGAVIVTVYVVVFLLPQAVGAISMLPYYHEPHDLGVLFVFVSSIALVFWLGVALVMSEKARKTTA